MVGWLVGLVAGCDLLASGVALSSVGRHVQRAGLNNQQWDDGRTMSGWERYELANGCSDHSSALRGWRPRPLAVACWSVVCQRSCTCV